MDWGETRERAIREHGERGRAPARGREDFRLAGIAGASWAAGLASAMLGENAAAAEWLGRAADEYVTSWRAAPPGSWGRPIAVLRCRLMAGDAEGARVDAEATLDEGALDAPGPIAAYCAALALLVLERDAEAVPLAERASREGLDPVAVADALGALARAESGEFARARQKVLRSFEERDAFLEDIRVADTVLVLNALARVRGIVPEPLRSALLPGTDPGD